MNNSKSKKDDKFYKKLKPFGRPSEQLKDLEIDTYDKASDSQCHKPFKVPEINNGPRPMLTPQMKSSNTKEFIFSGQVTPTNSKEKDDGNKPKIK